MRTTINLEPGLDRKLRARAAAEGKSLGRVVNETLHLGIAALEKPRQKAQPFRVRPVRGGLRPGLDWEKLNQLVAPL